MKETEYENIVEMRGITKRFPGCSAKANDNVDFSVRLGEIHALVGENGAGKTTLMNILYALLPPTSGQIFIKGDEKHFSSPCDAIEAGIGMVHQHFMLINSLTVAENVVLGIEPRRGPVFDRKTAVANVQRICDRYGFKINPEDEVEKISLGDRQKVEIIKAIYKKADIIIMDEPTAVLTPQEIVELGNILRDLKADGKSIVIITHKLQEVIDFSDRVTVLRQGRKVGTIRTGAHTPEDITFMMIGRQVNLAGNKQEVASDDKVLEVEQLSYVTNGIKKLDDVSFDIKKGEVFGIAGVDGSGQNELTMILDGYLKASGGSVRYKGKELTEMATKDIRALGIGMIPQSRHDHGLVLSMDLRENFMLGNADRKRFVKNGVFLDKPRIAEYADERIREYGISCNGSSAVAETLSGGNQQKVICARECNASVDMIVANQPSRGVDVGAIEHIHSVFINARNEGKSVLLISMELDEVMMLSDRIMVMFDGKNMGILDAKTATREQIGLMMVGRSAGAQTEV